MSEGSSDALPAPLGSDGVQSGGLGGGTITDAGEGGGARHLGLVTHFVVVEWS